MKTLLLILALLPTLAIAQEPQKPLTPLTVQMFMAQRPAAIEVAEWEKIMLQPTSPSLYPILLTQAMLDTLDARELDIRWRYERVGERRTFTKKNQHDE